MDQGRWDDQPRDDRWAFGRQIEMFNTELRNDPTLAYVPFDKQVEFHSAVGERRVKLLVAGNRGGKTTPASVEAAWWAMGAHPYKVCQLHWHGVDMKPLLEKMGIDHVAAWAEFEEKAAQIKSGEKEFLTWEDC